MSYRERQRPNAAYGQRIRHALPFLAGSAFVLATLALLGSWPWFACIVLFGCVATVTAGFAADALLPSIRVATACCAAIIMLNYWPDLLGLSGQSYLLGLDITALFAVARVFPVVVLLMYALALWLNAIAHYMRWTEDEKGPPLVL